MGGENSTQTTKLKFKEKPNPLKESKKEEKEEEEKKVDKNDIKKSKPKSEKNVENKHLTFFSYVIVK